MKTRDAIRLLSEEGSVEQRRRGKGSHRVFVHTQKRGIVVVPGHINAELSPGTWLSIQRAAG